MEDLFVTRLWMAGVVAMMLVFGITALVGLARQKNGEGSKTDHATNGD